MPVRPLFDHLEASREWLRHLPVTEHPQLSRRVGSQDLLLLRARTRSHEVGVAGVRQDLSHEPAGLLLERTGRLFRGGGKVENGEHSVPTDPVRLAEARLGAIEDVEDVHEKRDIEPAVGERQVVGVPPH